MFSPKSFFLLTHLCTHYQSFKFLTVTEDQNFGVPAVRESRVSAMPKPCANLGIQGGGTKVFEDLLSCMFHPVLTALVNVFGDACHLAG